MQNTVNRILEWNGVRPGGPYSIVSHEDSIGRNSKLYGDTIEEVKEDKCGISEMKGAAGSSLNHHSIYFGNDDNNREISPDRDGNEFGENKGGKNNDAVEEGRQTYLVGATLIEIVTFAAGFTMPYGYQSEKDLTRVLQF